MDEYAETNERLVVIHKENGGPAAARKLGIERSESDYLAFCDADDYVEPDWLLCMYTYLKRYNADFSMVGAYLNDVGIDKIYEEPFVVDVWNQNVAYEKYIEHRELNGVLWTNLFKRELFDGLCWNFKMRIYEDDNLIWQIIRKVDRVVKVHVPKYHYMFVPDSLSNRKFDQNWYESTMHMINMMIKDCQSEELTGHLDSIYRMRYGRFFSLAYNCTINNNNISVPDMPLLFKILRKDYFFYSDSIKSIKERIILLLLLCNPQIVKILYNLLRKQ